MIYGGIVCLVVGVLLELLTTGVLASLGYALAVIGVVLIVVGLVLLLVHRGRV